MSTISQRIPNLLSGISQQPDNRKRPGQVKDAVNVFPDYTLGMLKRPGAQFSTVLHGANSSTDARWFSILRDENEKYVAQYDDNVFRVWSLIDGGVRAVDMGSNTGVPGTCNLTTLKSEVTTLNTEVSDSATALAALQTAAATLAETIDGQTATVTKLFSISNTYTNDVKASLDSGILEDADGEYLVKNAGTVVASRTTTLPANYALGTERTDEHPLLASQGYRVYEAELTVAAANTAAELTTAETAYNNALTAYNTAKTNETTARTDYDTAATNCAITTIPADSLTVETAGSGLTDGTFDDEATVATETGSGLLVNLTVSGGAVTAATISTASDITGFYLHDQEISFTGTYAAVKLKVQQGGYLEGATADDIELLTLNDYTFVLNKAKTVRMTADKSAAQVNEGFVYINSVAPSTDYEIRLTYSGTTRTFTFQTSSSGHIDANTICVGLIAELADTSNYGGGAAEYTGVEVGSGIYITRTDGNEFDVETRGGSSDNAIYGFTDTVPNTSFLPIQAKNGYKVKIVNTTDVDIDDMWVEFQSSHNATYGGGAWVETTAPDVFYKLDPLTMPHQLVRQADGSFTYGPVTFIDRLVGDDNTNPLPSFVNNKISHIFFYRNRLGFLTGGSVVLSKAADFFNFFTTSAQIATDDDPIDITAAGTRPTFLNYVLPTAVGLVLYAETEQHLLTTDSDLFSPKTAKIRTLSTYEADADIAAVSLGTSQAFISKTPLYTRLFELIDISRDQPPLMNDSTVVVPELIPETVNSLVSSPGLSLASLGTKGSADVFQFRFLTASRQQRQLSTWYKWTLTGTLLDQFFDSSTFYTVVANGTEVTVESFDMSQSSEQGFLTLPTGEKTDVCLDLFQINPHRTYDETADTTRIFLPYDHVTNKQFTVIVLGGYIGQTTETSESIGSVQYIDEDDIDTTDSVANFGHFVDITGDYRGRNIIIGYNYDMELKLPKLFVYQSEGDNIKNDTESNLILHRLRVQTGLSGPVDYLVQISGLDDYTNTVTVTQPNVYKLNNVNMQPNATHVVPIHQRNQNLTITIKGTTPFPVSLLGFDWEGKYTTRFYRRI